MKVLIPSPLRLYAQNQAEVSVQGTTVAEVLAALVTRFPDLRTYLFSDDGKLRKFVNVYVNEEDIRYLPKKEQTLLRPEDLVSIIPSVAGGAEDLSAEERQRYARHLIMPEVGREGQLKLKAAKVLCVGTGGLGSPLAMYLAAAGVGTLGLVDFDTVDSSNLQRQIIHFTNDVGRPKLDSAEGKLKAINPLIQIKKFETRLTSANALVIFKDFDVIADGTDNFPTRYLVNDACVLTGKPNVYGSIFRFEGQASVFATAGGPCYRCLYPEPPPPGLVPSCAEGGVLGVLPGLVGIIQATETIKLILGAGEPLIGRLLLVDSLSMRFREMRLRKNPDCPMCGERASIKELIDYNQFCGITEEKPQPMSVPEMSVQELKRRMDAKDDLQIVDVRELNEYHICNIGAQLIPLGELQQRLNELDPEKETVVHCRSGKRSMMAALLMQQMGFQNVHNLAGGILDWADKIDPTMPKY